MNIFNQREMDIDQSERGTNDFWYTEAAQAAAWSLISCGVRLVVVAALSGIWPDTFVACDPSDSNIQGNQHVYEKSTKFLVTMMDHSNNIKSLAKFYQEGAAQIAVHVDVLNQLV